MGIHCGTFRCVGDRRGGWTFGIPLGTLYHIHGKGSKYFFNDNVHGRVTYVCVQSMKVNTYVAEESEYAARAYDAAKPAIANAPTQTFAN